ncbi:hypothetical protein GQ600_3759 [Phytophthora cactorum]|nr:hypothetical protein GQ600_3759 [Phytophthora cactorum]
MGRFCPLSTRRASPCLGGWSGPSVRIYHSRSARTG